MKVDQYHIPVLLKEATKALISDPSGFYVDVTFGGGGHSRAILDQIDNGKLLAFDQDADASINHISDNRFSLVRQNFKNIQNVLEAFGHGAPIGVLADLGVSSYQFDNPERGFSFRFDERLDMRMNKDAALDACDLINTYDKGQLENIFSQFGDFKAVESKRLSANIIEARTKNKLGTTQDLVSCIEFLVPQKVKNQFLARVFQSIRIEVNQELNALVDFLSQLPKVLKNGGIISIITYHSLEDRLVKNFLKTGNCKGDLEKDFFGNISKTFDLINKKPIVPDAAEIKLNPRSRSAKLRIAKKINDSF